MANSFGPISYSASKLSRPRFTSRFVVLLSSAIALFVSASLPARAKASSLKCEQAFEDRSRAATAYENSVLDRLRKGSNSYEDADKLAAEILKFDADTRRGVEALILANYRKLPKRIVDPSRAKILGPRRLADRVLSVISPSDLAFAQKVESGSSVRDAFAILLNDKMKATGSTYSAQDVIAIVEMLKSDLKVRQSEIGRYQFKIYLGGSFVNGKANLLESDLDITINDLALKRIAPQWESSANAILMREHSKAALKVELHSEPAAFYGALNPFVFEITDNQIQLHVYGPATRGDVPIYLRAQNFTIYAWD